MNPCSCGFFPDTKKCKCSINEIIKYQNKISQPILDRIDVSINVAPVEFNELFDKKIVENSKTIKERVLNAVDKQIYRYREENFSYNSHLDNKGIKKYIKINYDIEDYLKAYFNEKALSARGIYRVIKIAQTICDLSDEKHITKEHIKEAIFYRNERMRNGKNI